ncbi:hypothetical protein QVZ43_04005 [Marinobacter sp. chi1]|uniref:Uncharacterized protein n=1 Tax=Marinobacter suaedae TaxID=3057675 RepID=A0ABT8VY01_9GAMM|nr:hypothetical protein [Marinobacter sp. chi1]MDO3720873.1 hypothetical protein [Marinobacter sp. chi1]
MGRNWWLVVWMALLLEVLTGCASPQYAAEPTVAVSRDCDRHFTLWRNWVVSDDRFDAQEWSPPGFPYLRVDRFLASFDLTELTPAQRRDWLGRAYDKADIAWQFEVQGGPDASSQWLDDLRSCALQAVSKLGAESDLWLKLAESVQVPDSYSTPAQVLGVYPLVKPVVRWRAGVTMGELVDQYGHYKALAGWRTYVPDLTDVVGRSEVETYPLDSLGVPVLGESLRLMLFQRHAPAWRIETRDSHDVPGIPARGLNGQLQFRPEPVVFTHLSFARMRGRILPQLVYVLWFSGRPSEHWLDIYAGELDGFIWRVTLGPRGQPLAYDTIHPCGCYHQWLLPEGGLVKSVGVDYEAEQIWLLGSLPLGGKEAPLLSLSAGDHQLVGASGFHPTDLGAEIHSYRLESLDGLRGLSNAGGRLYGDDGLIAGTERLERFLLWPTGVPSAGGMRQWGRHAVSFVGRRHFDDPHLLDRYFLPPP